MRNLVSKPDEKPNVYEQHLKYEVITSIIEDNESFIKNFDTKPHDACDFLMYLYCGLRLQEEYIDKPLNKKNTKNKTGI